MKIRTRLADVVYRLCIMLPSTRRRDRNIACLYTISWLEVLRQSPNILLTIPPAPPTGLGHISCRNRWKCGAQSGVPQRSGTSKQNVLHEPQCGSRIPLGWELLTESLGTRVMCKSTLLFNAYTTHSAYCITHYSSLEMSCSRHP